MKATLSNNTAGAAMAKYSGGLFIAHAKALPGNPYDGHTLATVIPEIETQIGANLARIVADRGYRGHNAPPDHKFKVYISGQRRRVTETIKRQLRRRSAVEPVIGHAKTEHRMGRTISPAPMATPPTPSSPPPDTISAGSSPGSPPFGVSSSWPSSPPPVTLPSQRQTAPEAHRSPTPRPTSRSSQSTTLAPASRSIELLTLFGMQTMRANVRYWRREADLADRVGIHRS